MAEPSPIKLAITKVCRLDELSFLLIGFFIEDGVISYEDFKKLFANNKNIIEEFVLENTSLETLESWYEQKVAVRAEPEPPLTKSHHLDSWKVG